MHSNTVTDTQTRRLLKMIARRSALELAQLRDIGQTAPGLNYFYDVLESVFVRNDANRFLGAGSEKKKKIGIYCMLVPEELIYAAGAIPVRLCAGCFESSQIGEDWVPRDGCPLVKSSMGLSIRKGLTAFDLCDAVIVPTTCDAKRKFGEELSSFKDVWMLEVPHIKDAEFSRRIWVEQMYALKSKLEDHVKNGRPSRKITPRNLDNAIKKSARAQSEMRRLLSFRVSTTPVIWGRQAIAVANAYAYAPVKDWTQALVQLNHQLSEKAHQAETVCAGHRPRIFIAGSPVIFPNMKVPSLVEEMGGIVVGDESCTGDRYLYDPVGHTERTLNDQMIGIASRYLAPCICPSFSPNEDRLTIINKLVSESAVDGVLYHVLKGCVIYDFEVHRVERALKTTGVPLLRIETDYNPEDIEQLRTRIEAFIEMLKGKSMKTRSERQ